MPSFSARNDTLCNAFGAAILGLIAATAAYADAQSPAPANNYPTIARVEYVQECMNRAGAHQGTMYQCACAIDWIADKLSYDDFVEASTYAKYATLPGEGGGIFRDTDEAKQKAKLFRTLESDAYRACNVPGREK
jgi:hypothetical protein